MKQAKFSIPDDLHAWVRRRARLEQRSESSVIREALYLYVQAKESQRQHTTEAATS